MCTASKIIHLQFGGLKLPRKDESSQAPAARSLPLPSLKCRVQAPRIRRPNRNLASSETRDILRPPFHVPIMAPKNRKSDTSATIPASAAAPSHSVPSAAGRPSGNSRASATSSKNASDAQQILQGIWDNYVDKTPQRTKLIDIFLAFLAVVGALQFVYCIIAGNYVSDFSCRGNSWEIQTAEEPDTWISDRSTTIWRLNLICSRKNYADPS